MNKKQLYESIMTSVAKEVKKVLNESKKYEFSKNDLLEIKDYILNDQDFYETFCKYANIDRYDSYEESVDDFIDFLENAVYTGIPKDDKNIHEFYILDEPDSGTSWMKLTSGKLANCDNIWMEYKSIISEK